MVRKDVVLYFFIGQLVFGPGLTVHAMGVARKHVLSRAIKKNNLFAVEKLLAGDLDIESELSGSTLLFVAVRAGFPDMIRLLLAKGASPNAQTSKKYFFFSPFMYALAKSPSALVALFFEKNAKIKPAEQYMGDKPDRFARVMNKRDMLKCYEKDKIPQYDYSLRLAICSKLEALEKVKLLIANGFSLNIYFPIDGYSPCNPIEYAEGFGYKSIVDYLLPIFEKMCQVKLEKRKKRLAGLKKLLKPLPYRNVPGLAIGTIGKIKTDIKICFAMRKRQLGVEPEGYCQVQ